MHRRRRENIMRNEERGAGLFYIAVVSK